MNVLRLKVNVCSLAAESKIIRRQVDELKKTRPRKGADEDCQALIHHRRWDLRNESRATQLLYGFMRGVPHEAMERHFDDSNYKWRDTLKRLRTKCNKWKIDWNEVKSWLSKDRVVAG